MRDNENHAHGCHASLSIIIPHATFVRIIQAKVDTLGIIKVEIIDRERNSHVLELPTDVGLNMMEVCTAANLPINTLCGGLGLCGHCHVYVESEHELSSITHQEAETLGKLVNMKMNSRLACQIRLGKEINGLKLQLAPAE